MFDDLKDAGEDVVDAVDDIQVVVECGKKLAIFKVCVKIEVMDRIADIATGDEKTEEVICNLFHNVKTCQSVENADKSPAQVISLSLS